MNRIPDDTSYLNGSQIPIYENIKWVEYIRCKVCGKATPHLPERIKDRLWWKCKECGHYRSDNE